MQVLAICNTYKKPTAIFKLKTAYDVIWKLLKVLLKQWYIKAKFSLHLIDDVYFIQASRRARNMNAVC